MKAPNPLLLLIIFTAVASLNSPLLRADDSPTEGTKDSGGGNAQVSAFFQMAEHFNSQMMANGKRIDKTFPATELKKRMSTLAVVSVPGPLILDGVKVDAINRPSENKIELDDATWSQRSKKEKYQIVVHELLGLLGINDFQYKTSEKLAKATEGEVEAGDTPYRLGRKQRFEGAIYQYAGCSKPEIADHVMIAQNLAVKNCMNEGYRACKVVHSYHERKDVPNSQPTCSGHAVAEGRLAMFPPQMRAIAFDRNEYMHKRGRNNHCTEGEIAELKRLSAEKAKAECLAEGWRGCTVVFSRLIAKTKRSVPAPRNSRDLPIIDYTCGAHSIVDGFARRERNE